MKKSVKIWLIVATALVLAGAGLFLSALLMVDFDFTRLSSVKMESNTYTVHDSFHSIHIDTSTADIRFLPSEDRTCKVVCYEKETVKHAVYVENGMLKVQYSKDSKWYDMIGWSASPEITVYLPGDEFMALTVETSTGNIELHDFYFHTISLSTSTGNIDIDSVWCAEDIQINVTTGITQLTDIQCDNLTTEGSTGDLRMRDVRVDESLIIRRDTGDVRFDSCNAASILVETNTGDVRGTLRTRKTFIVNTNTGEINIPEGSSGGRCEITTDTGDIHIEILEM